ncbi:disulfide bond formation protein B [Pseudomonas phoenicis]|uniref:disulfide bond formation protein B n=1 Tax=unclassified Pseudomonas TaxID=196821 RepID=UPI0039A3BB96
MSLFRLRTLFLPAVLASLTLLVGSLSLLPQAGLERCALCYSQRFLLASYLVLGVCAMIHAPDRRSARRYALGLLGCAALGGWLAARQVWLQGSYETAQACSVPLTTLLDLPVGQLLQQLLLGVPSCSPIRWSFLDLTLPEWSLLAFLGLACLPLSHLLSYRFRRLTNQFT